MQEKNREIERLRREMVKRELDYCLIFTNDDHNSEYVADYYKVREYFSHFTGSAGTLLVGKEDAYLWTDGRYFLQAEQELAGTGIQLMKSGEPGVPRLTNFLGERIGGQRLGVNFRTLTLDFYETLRLMMPQKSKTETTDRKSGCLEDILVDFDAGTLMSSRAKRPANPCFLMPKDLRGEECVARIARIRSVLDQKAVRATFVSRLDDIMWLFQIRGNDIAYNPVALSYAYLSQTEAVLFIQDGVLPSEAENYLKEQGVQVLPYDSVIETIEQLPEGTVLVDSENLSYGLYQALKGNKKLTLQLTKGHPITDDKACKNAVEQEAIRRVYLRDSAALTEFLYECKTGNLPESVARDEYSLAMHLDSYRRALPGYIELSFPTICAWGSNGAIIHYDPEPETAAKVTTDGFLMVDSGGQYYGGTTDVTRTMALGEITQEMRRNYTLVLKGHLALKNAIFKRESTGRNLDILARGPLWKAGLDYRHGTGHGIGYMLNVHEGPQRISSMYLPGATEAKLKPGMLISDEPGFYKDGEYGLRIENILLVKEYEKGEQLLCFEDLTLVPYDRDAMDLSLLDQEEIESLNAYSRLLRTKLAPLLREKARAWLYEQTEPI